MSFPENNLEKTRHPLDGHPLDNATFLRRLHENSQPAIRLAPPKATSDSSPPMTIAWAHVDAVVATSPTSSLEIDLPAEKLPAESIEEGSWVRAMAYAFDCLREQYRQRTQQRAVREQLESTSTKQKQLWQELGEVVEKDSGTREHHGHQLGVLELLQHQQRTIADEAAVQQRKMDEQNQLHAARTNELQTNITERSANLDQLTEHLKRQRQELSALKRAHAKTDRTLRRAQTAHDKLLQRVDASDDPADGEVLKRSASDVAADIESITTELDNMEKRLEEVEAPLVQAKNDCVEAREQLRTAQRELRAAIVEHKKQLRENERVLGAAKLKKEAVRQQIASEWQTLGQDVDQNRVNLALAMPLYSVLDGIAVEKEKFTRQLQEIAAQLKAYDRATLVRGLIGWSVVGLISLAFLALIIVVLA